MTHLSTTFPEMSPEDWRRLEAAREAEAQAWEAEKARWRRCSDPDCTYPGIHYHEKT